MPVQDFIGTYDLKMQPGYAGMVAESQDVCDIASKMVTTAAVAFGLAVGAGATDGSVRLGGTGFEGIAVADKTRLADSFAIGEMAGVLRKGTVWVIATTAVTPATPPTFTAATGVIGAGLATAIPNSKFETSASIGGLARLYIG
jgi:hypothetical protein